MYVQITSFDGPRSAELVAASTRAGRERIEPLINADPELSTRLIGGFRAVAPDGTEVIVVLAQDESSLDALQHLVMTSELLPGEDPALLPGPTRVDRYPAALFGSLAQLLAGADR